MSVLPCAETECEMKQEWLSLRLAMMGITCLMMAAIRTARSLRNGLVKESMESSVSAFQSAEMEMSRLSIIVKSVTMETIRTTMDATQNASLNCPLFTLALEP